MLCTRTRTPRSEKDESANAVIACPPEAALMFMYDPLHERNAQRRAKTDRIMCMLTCPASWGRTRTMPSWCHKDAMFPFRCGTGAKTDCSCASSRRAPSESRQKPPLLDCIPSKDLPSFLLGYLRVFARDQALASCVSADPTSWNMTRTRESTCRRETYLTSLLHFGW